MYKIYNNIRAHKFTFLAGSGVPLAWCWWRLSCFGNEKLFQCLYFRFSLTFLRECRTLLVLLILLRGIIHYSEACVLRVHTTRHISKAKSCKVTISNISKQGRLLPRNHTDWTWHIFASLMTDIWWLHHRTIKIKWFQQTIWSECVCGCWLCLVVSHTDEEQTLT